MQRRGTPILHLPELARVYNNKSSLDLGISSWPRYKLETHYKLATAPHINQPDEIKPTRPPQTSSANRARTTVERALQLDG